MIHLPIEICEDDQTEETFFQGRVCGVAFNIMDSIANGRLNKINDDEVHKENTHLEDILIPRCFIPEVTGEDRVAHDVLAKVIPPAGENPDSDEQQDHPKRNVRFGSVIIRDYDMILGDNPSCESGIPLAIGWDYTEYLPLDVDKYELNRSPRRNMANMQVSKFHRMRLILDAGFTKEDINHTLKQINRTKRNRTLTMFVATTYPLMEDVEAVVESARRKFKRLIKNDKGKAGKMCLTQK
jgi:hypothetical protein